jgi:hypothetical protein
MHRDPSLTFSETIARLETEICELRALGGKRRERRLVAAAVLSMIVAFHAVLACVVMKVRVDRLAGDTSKRLEQRTGELVSCVHRLDALSRPAMGAQKN